MCEIIYALPNFMQLRSPVLKCTRANTTKMNFAFSDATQYGEVSRRFGGVYCFHHLGSKNK